MLPTDDDIDADVAAVDAVEKVRLVISIGSGGDDGGGMLAAVGDDAVEPGCEYGCENAGEGSVGDAGWFDVVVGSGLGERERERPVSAAKSPLDGDSAVGVTGDDMTRVIERGMLVVGDGRDESGDGVVLIVGADERCECGYGRGICSEGYEESEARSEAQLRDIWNRECLDGRCNDCFETIASTPVTDDCGRVTVLVFCFWNALRRSADAKE